MLKLERIEKTLDLNITLRKRERTFNRAMLQAIGIGLGLHLIAFFLFPIATAKFTGSLKIIPPVSVVADLPQVVEGGVIADIDLEELSPRYLFPKKMAKLELPPLNELPPVATYSKELPVFTSQYEQLDPLTELLDPPLKLEPIMIHVSGPLSRYERVGAIPVPTLPQGDFRVIFQVAMENRTGEIFWYERKESEVHEKISQFAEQIVQKLRFEKSQDTFVTNGEIEILFSS